jgi:hypothetical protein
MLDFVSTLTTLGSTSISLPTTLTGIAILVVALLLLWVVVSIPVYAAGKLVTSGKSDFGDAMGATLGGALGYFLVLWGGAFFLSFIIAPYAALIIAFILALVVWLAVYRASFDTGWAGAIGIVVVAWAVFFILDILLVTVFGVSFPKFFPF